MRKNKPYTLLDKAEPYLWILPSVILMAIFIIVPIGSVFQMAFSEVNKAGIIKGFAGFENFAKVLKSSKFALVLKNTAVWTVCVVVISTVLGFILALLLNNTFKGRKLCIMVRKSYLFTAYTLFDHAAFTAESLVAVLCIPLEGSKGLWYKA